MKSLLAELVGVALIAAGTYLVAGVGPALIAAGALVVIGAQFYGLPASADEDDEDDDDGRPAR